MTSQPKIVCHHCGKDHEPSAKVCPVTGRSMGDAGMVGLLINSKYQIIKLLGAGGMGEVYDCEHMGTGRRVCMKRLRPEFRIDEIAMARFEREARVAAAIDHEHVIEIIDVGMAEDGSPYFVMPRLNGESLAALMEREAPLTVQRGCHIAVQVLRALQAAHDKGVIHRDLKPDNVFLQQKPSSPDHVTLLDFGISKAGGEAKLTSTGSLLGTPAYMSPEQARGDRNIDLRTDLWSFGVMLYEMLTGYPGFDGRSFPEMLMKIISDPPPALRNRRPELPERLLTCCDRLLSREREDRYATASEVLAILEPLSGGRNTSAEAFAGTLATPLGVTAVPEAARGSSARSAARPAASGMRSSARGVASSGIHLSEEAEAAGGVAVSTTSSPSMHGEIRPTTLMKSGGNRPLAAVAAVVLVGGALSLGYVAYMRNHPAPAPALIAAAPATSPTAAAPSPTVAPAAPTIAAATTPVPAAVPPSTPPPAATVAADRTELTVFATPPTARIAIDGAEVDTNPFTARFPLDGGGHTITASAPGFVDARKLVIFDAVKVRTDLFLARKSSRGSSSSSRSALPGALPTEPDPEPAPTHTAHASSHGDRAVTPPTVAPKPAQDPTRFKQGKLDTNYPGGN